ncbi:MAG: hypothetical protein KA163_05975 [Bacteroidia bacterium]|nr:hypothetical protein [Bacteroidia bacterium]
MYILNDTDQDPAMRYEGLARFAFDCDRAGGPGNIAEAGVFDSEFVPDITADGLVIINQILDALIVKTDGYIKDELNSIKDSLTGGMSQQSGIELIDSIIKLLK